MQEISCDFVAMAVLLSGHFEKKPQNSRAKLRVSAIFVKLEVKIFFHKNVIFNAFLPDITTRRALAIAGSYARHY